MKAAKLQKFDATRCDLSLQVFQLPSVEEIKKKLPPGSLSSGTWEPLGVDNFLAWKVGIKMCKVVLSWCV